MYNNSTKGLNMPKGQS